MKHITITGSLGSGKSIVSSILKENLRMEIESVGSLLRKMAQNYGMSTNDFNKYMERHPEFDYELDHFVEEQGLDPIPKIFDSRLAWHFIPQSYKIYLYVNDEIAAIRVYCDNNRINEEYENEEDALFHIIERRKSEILRFKTQYSIDLDNFSNYNLIIDTGFSTPNDIADMIIGNYKKNNPNQNEIWLSPHTLLPTQSIQNHSLHKTENIYPFFSKKEDYQNNPVTIIHDNNQFYIYDGHKRVLHAMKNKVTLLPCQLINTKGDNYLPNGQSIIDYLNDNFCREYYFEWKDFVKHLKK